MFTQVISDPLLHHRTLREYVRVVELGASLDLHDNHITIDMHHVKIPCGRLDEWGGHPPFAF